MHDEVPFVAAQTFPQAPQLVRLVLRFASQPFAAFLSQSPKPVLHALIWHVPPLHGGSPCATEQTWPQVPQLLTSLLVSAMSSAPALVVCPLATTTEALLAVPLCVSATTAYVPAATESSVKVPADPV